ncbi:hypothetical protein ACFYPX_09040 [Micromonospora zamorensis]|uniref:hypothetical protein n=1 Tax=Micromonospora zamorensis TaxID=709883 RepID=UPI0036897882
MSRPIPPSRRMAVGVLGSVLLTACQAGTPTPTHRVLPPSASPTQPPATAPSVTVTGPGLTPQQRLMALAANIGGTPDDDTSHLPYTYLHVQTWARSTNAITRTDLQRWRRNADGSGQEAIRKLPDLSGVNHRPRPEERHLLARSRKTVTRHARGGLHPHLPEPLPTDPATLTGLLASRELAAEPGYPRMLVHGVVGLAVSQYLSRDQRAACLRALADVRGITYEGGARDVAGRAGLAFKVAAGGSTSTLIVDARTGELLAAEEQVAGVRPGLFSYYLVLERGHTAKSGVALRP